MAAGEQNVFGLDVPMDDALLVGVGNRVPGLTHDRARGFDGHLPIAVHPDPERLAFHEGHDVVEQGLDVARVMEREDVGVLETRHQPDLADESYLSGFRGRVGVEDLDRDATLVLEVAREIYGSESTLADLALELVAPAEGHAKCGDRVGEGGSRVLLADLAHRRQCTVSGMCSRRGRRSGSGARRLVRTIVRRGQSI